MDDSIEPPLQPRRGYGRAALAHPRAGRPIYYIAPEISDEIIREHPDGRLEEVQLVGDSVIEVIRPLALRGQGRA